MLTVTKIAQLNKVLAEWRNQDERIALVPTMGNLHAGHLSLVECAKSKATKTVVTVFINPMQFDRAEDLAAYPRTLTDDQKKLEALETDLLFAPDFAEIYPHGTDNTTYVEVPGLSDILCGASRPGHFRGVATVVVKLFNLVQPHVAVFGDKDYQQLLLLRRVVGDLNFPVEIIGVTTQRDPEGLALSSRNSYLTFEERKRAATLYATLNEMVERIREGERDYRELETLGAQQLKQLGFRPDYVSICRQQDLAEADASDGDLVILAAVFMGRARLIDNIALSLNDIR
jgi:pantoate--beta-alanine ligase